MDKADFPIRKTQKPNPIPPDPPFFPTTPKPKVVAKLFSIYGLSWGIFATEREKDFQRKYKENLKKRRRGKIRSSGYSVIECRHGSAGKNAIGAAQERGICMESVAKVYSIREIVRVYANPGFGKWKNMIHLQSRYALWLHVSINTQSLEGWL